jgi:hypothetical protein
MFLLAIVSTVIPSFLISEAIHRISPLQTSIVGISMGTKSMTEILNQDSNNSLISFTQWRQKHAST